jgi:hypothetical protein
VNAKSLLAAKRGAKRQDRDEVATKASVKNVLVIDVGGTSVKILAPGQSERLSFSSGPTLPEANDFRGE